MQKEEDEEKEAAKVEYSMEVRQLMRKATQSKQRKRVKEQLEM